ncbi:MAG: hypothetical protein ABIO35_03295 [Nitrobacter sp.]
MISRQSTAKLLAVATSLITARLVFDFTSAAAYVYPELDFGQNGIAFVIFVLAVLGVLVLAFLRLFQKRLVEAGGLLIICHFPFSFNEAVDRQFWKFRIHKSEYQSIMQADPGPPPKYKVFNWGNRNTQLIGGGVIVEAVVYDQSDEIRRWSPEWIEPRSNPSAEDQWITAPSDYPSCERRIKSLGNHFYYVAEEC